MGKAPSFCEDPSQCHQLDGFMFDVGLNDDAKKRVLISSISFAYKSPKNKNGANIVLYMTEDGSYIDKKKSPFSWRQAASVTAFQYNFRREEGIININLGGSVVLE